MSLSLASPSAKGSKNLGMKRLRFVDLFAGVGGFHVALSRLGHECVFASEIDPELRELYLKNFPDMGGRVFGDIRESKGQVPEHDFLCAGFPCQPFSKSGAQLGTKDETRGTLFHEILEILEKWRPRYVLLENVGNFGRHDGGRTWKIVKQRLLDLGYHVAGTEHVTPAAPIDWRDRGLEGHLRSRVRTNIAHDLGEGLISPHHFGYPHHRERFYIYASLDPLPDRPFPPIDKTQRCSLAEIVQNSKELDEQDVLETSLTQQQIDCIEHWNKLIQSLPAATPIPTFPIWGDEFGASYPYETTTPWSSTASELGKCFKPPYPPYTRKTFLLEQLPNYAREEVEVFRNWKIRFIDQNRVWWKEVSPDVPLMWRAKLRTFPPSLRKLEWNAKGERKDLWSYVLQFRPSGLRVRRYKTCPALVAMTDTQIPILGPKRRFITRVEGKRLQGLDDDHHLPASRKNAFKALGNAVHARVVEMLAQRLIEHSDMNLPEAVEEPLPLFA